MQRRRHDDRPRVDPNAGRQLDVVSRCDLAPVTGQCLVYGQSRAHGPFGVVAVRHGRAEEGEQTVARVLGHGAAEAAHLLLLQARQLVEEELRALGTETLADRGRVDDVGDQHRHDPTLADGLAHGAILTSGEQCY